MMVHWNDEEQEESKPCLESLLIHLAAVAMVTGFIVLLMRAA